MIVIVSLPILCSSLLIAAHCYRAEWYSLTAVSLLVPLLLFIRNRWTPRLVGSLLILFALEWLRTMFVFIGRYQETGMDWTRLALILIVVALFTAASPLVFKTAALRRRYAPGRKLG